MILTKTNLESGFEISGNQLHVRSKNVYLKGNTDAQMIPSESMKERDVSVPLDIALRLVGLTPIAIYASSLNGGNENE